MKFKLPWKSSTTPFEKLKESGRVAEEVANKNSEWHQRTGRPVEERPGYQDDIVRYNKISQEAASLFQKEQEESNQKFDKERAELQSGREAGKALEDASGYTEWKQKRGSR